MFAFDSGDGHFGPQSARLPGRRLDRAGLAVSADGEGGFASEEGWVASGLTGGGGAETGGVQELQGGGVQASGEGVTDGAGGAVMVVDEVALSQTLCPNVTTPPISITPRLSAATTLDALRGEQRGKAIQTGVTANAPHLTGRAARKKKRGMKKGAPAMSTVRGFTPAASGDDDSDCSTASSSRRLAPRFGELTSSTSSPGLRPSSSGGGISALRLQLDTLNLSPGSDRLSSMVHAKSKLGSQTPSSASMTSETMSDGEANEMTSYEIPLEHDFVSPDVGQRPIYGAVEGGLVRDPAPRKMAASDFQPISCLGKGTYGTVLLVKQTATGRLYAQKQFRKASLTVHKKLVEQTKTERSILESVNRHPFVVKLYYAFQDHEKLYLILEYAQGGELFTHLAMERMFPEPVASFYLAEMVLALEHLHHTVGVVYRDLKPENCLLDSEGHLLLTDFGLSKVAISSSSSPDRCNSILGTIEYMAPEVILGRAYGHAVDWWSLGALAHDLLTGSPPFAANNHAKIQDKIVRQKLALPYFLGPDAKDLLTRLLRKEPARRLGANMPRDLATIKAHRFFRKIDWHALERRELEPPIKPLVTDPALAENFASEFTDLPLSPVVGDVMAQQSWAGAVSGRSGDAVGAGSWGPGMGVGVGVGTGSAVDVGSGGGAGMGETDPFGGFSFVASRSLLECGDGFF